MPQPRVGEASSAVGAPALSMSPPLPSAAAGAQAGERVPVDAAAIGNAGRHAAHHGGGALMKNQVQLQLRHDGRYEIEPIPDDLSFEKGFFLFVRAIQQLKAVTDGTLIVGLAGPSGAGKTVFSQKVSDFIDGVAILSMDMYNDATHLVDDNFDDPRLTDYELLYDNLTKLRDGYEVEAPIYDFKTSRRVGYRKVPVPPSKVVVIEGIYALSERLRPLIDLRVSITGGVHFDLVKRVMRDVSRSGQEPQAIIQQISETVYPMYKAYIEPDLHTAHIRIVNTFNPFSGFQEPVFILKSDNVANITEESMAALFGGPDRYVAEEVETHDIYLLPPGEDPETCNTWLRMRNRDGMYSLMFEEWLTDGPFVISPRISFDVSVRVLGGLMALGYEIGSIVRRSSTHYRHLSEPKKTPSASSMPSPLPSPRKAPAPSRTDGGADAEAAAEPSAAAAAPAPSSSSTPSPPSALDAKEAIASMNQISTSLDTSSGWSSDSQFAIKVDHFAGLERAYVNIQGRNREEVAAAGRSLNLDGTYIAQSYIELLQLESLTKEMNVETAWLRESYMQQLASSGASPSVVMGPVGEANAAAAGARAHAAADTAAGGSKDSSPPMTRMGADVHSLHASGSDDSGSEGPPAIRSPDHPRRYAHLVATQPRHASVGDSLSKLVNGASHAGKANFGATQLPKTPSGGIKGVADATMAIMRAKHVSDALERAASALEQAAVAQESSVQAAVAAAEAVAAAAAAVAPSRAAEASSATLTTAAAAAAAAALAGVAVGAWLTRK